MVVVVAMLVMVVGVVVVVVVVVVVNSGNIGDSYGVYEDVRCSTLCSYGSQ